MAYDLEDVDLVRERMGVGYGEAKRALDEADGDVIGALAIIEQRQQQTAPSGAEDALTRIGEEVRQSLGGGMVKAIRIRLGGETVKEVPVAVAGVGAILLSLVAALLQFLTLEIISNSADETDHEDTT